MFVSFPSLGTRIDTSNEWLLQKLPGLPCFADFYPQLSHQLRSACIVESDPAAVSLYIQFLAHYTPEGLHDLADLCLDMSATVVERSTLLTAIMPGSMCKTNQVSNHGRLYFRALFASHSCAVWKFAVYPRLVPRTITNMPVLEF